MLESITHTSNLSTWKEYGENMILLNFIIGFIIAAIIIFLLERRDNAASKKRHEEFEKWMRQWDKNYKWKDD
jgi:hypothetical protein